MNARAEPYSVATLVHTQSDTVGMSALRKDATLKSVLPAKAIKPRAESSNCTLAQQLARLARARAQTAKSESNDNGNSPAVGKQWTYAHMQQTHTYVC